MVYHNDVHIFSLNLVEAKLLFDNLKKRFNKKKAKYKKATRSGSGSRKVKQAETELEKYDFLSWLAPYLRLKENTISNLPNSNVAEINPNDDHMTKAEDSFGDCSKKSIVLRVSTNQSFETLWQNHCKVKKRKEEVKQTPEKPNKELETMKDISKPLKSPPSRDDLFGMMLASSPKKKRKTKFKINNLLFNYREDNDTAAVPRPPPIQTPPLIQTYGNANTNLPRISLNELWLYDSLRKYMNLKHQN